MKVLWVDTETTGLNPVENGVHQVAGLIELSVLDKANPLIGFDINANPLPHCQVSSWYDKNQDCEISYRKIYCTRHTFITAMLNSEKYKLLTIAKIVGHSSIKTLVENYAGFIRDEHLMIDCEVDIFEEKRHSLDTAVKKLKL